MRSHKITLGLLCLASAFNAQAALPTNYSPPVELPGIFTGFSSANPNNTIYRGITDDKKSIRFGLAPDGITGQSTIFNLLDNTESNFPFVTLPAGFQGDKVLFKDQSVSSNNALKSCDIYGSCANLLGSKIEGLQLLRALFNAGDTRLINDHGYAAFSDTTNSLAGKIFSPTGGSLYPSNIITAPNSPHGFVDITSGESPYVIGFELDSLGSAAYANTIIVKIENGLASQQLIFSTPVIPDLEANNELLLPVGLTQDLNIIYRSHGKNGITSTTSKFYSCQYSVTLNNCASPPVNFTSSNTSVFIMASNDAFITANIPGSITPTSTTQYPKGTFGRIFTFSNGQVESSLDFSSTNLLAPGEHFIPLDMNSNGDIIGWFSDDDSTTDYKWAYILSSSDNSSSDNTLTVVPDDLEIIAADSTALNVNLDMNATDLYGLQVTCTADPAILKIESGAYQGLFDSADRLDIPQTIDMATGTWSGASSLKQPAIAITKQDNFASLNYTAQPTLGETEINCTALGSDNSGNPITVSVINATVKVDDGIHQPNGSVVSGSLSLPIGTDYSGIIVSLTLDGVTITTTTDATGNFSFDNIRNGDFTLSYQSPTHVLACDNLGVNSARGKYFTLNGQAMVGGDLNNNGQIDMGDVAFIASHFGTSTGDANFDEKGDINQDGTINIQDLALIGSAFGTDTNQCKDADLVKEFREITLQGKCLDFVGTSPANLANAVTYNCENVSWQKWHIAENGQIQSKTNPGFCLDMEGTTPANGSRALMYECTDVAWQKWAFDDQGRIHSQANPNFCLDIIGTQAEDNTQIITNECADIETQRWSIGVQ